ncbi:hypothetical protein EGW08_015900 [Elysia chlorotica]|uniref:3CxxC-type domain-containing protein n=1 Tax=Elysia chlorotica TaxID=188477 RepID=A0A433T455_ELYCH|nr:hypothetical protein EGW08_015900 [Elysia chlorotica]
MASDLTRSYGFFRCPDCKKQWESSHVYGGFVNRKFKTEYGQMCKACNIMVKPYRTERLKCRECGLETCICTLDDKRRKRNIDEKKPHRSDLCEKCRNGIPCAQSF